MNAENRPPSAARNVWGLVIAIAVLTMSGYLSYAINSKGWRLVQSAIIG